MKMHQAIASSLFELGYEIITYVPGSGANHALESIKQVYAKDFQIFDPLLIIYGANLPLII